MTRHRQVRGEDVCFCVWVGGGGGLQRYERGLACGKSVLV